VAFRENPLGELKVPLALTAAAVLLVCVVVAAALLLSDRRETFQSEAYGVTRQVGDAVAAPVSGAVAAPARWSGGLIENIRGYFFAVSENRALRAELREARQWRDVAIALRDTNDRYKALLGLRTEPPIPMIAARTVTDSRGPFANTRLANAGKEKGVQAGNPVMSENGLVGRIIGVTTGASRILLLTDVASRTPVMIDRTNARAILTGDGGPNPKLEYLRGKDPVVQGDRVLTSGDGGVLPRGLPVGIAVKGLDGRWRVSLASDAAPVDFVRILLFQDFSQLANADELDEMHVPPPSAAKPVALAPKPVAAKPPAVPTADGKPSAPASPTPAAKSDAKGSAATPPKPTAGQPVAAPPTRPQAAKPAATTPARPATAKPAPAADAPH
jgi:rod shape-determining protein MreC